MRGYSITRLLKLPEYKITKVISETKGNIHIRVEPYKRKKAKCGGCGAQHNIGRHSQEEVVVRDKPIIDLKVYLHIIKRFYRCPVDGRIYVEEVDWLKKWSRVTKRFAECSFQLNNLLSMSLLITNFPYAWLI